MEVDPNKVILRLQSRIAELELDKAVLGVAVEGLNEELAGLTEHLASMKKANAALARPANTESKEEVT